jgi:hypothetical protein
MADPLHQVVMAAAELRLAAPQEYEKFVAAVKTYEIRCQADFLAAEASGIFSAQGKAQLIVQLRQKLENCHQLRANFEARTS